MLNQHSLGNREITRMISTKQQTLNQQKSTSKQPIERNKQLIRPKQTSIVMKIRKNVIPIFSSCTQADPNNTIIKKKLFYEKFLKNASTRLESEESILSFLSLTTSETARTPLDRLCKL